MHAVATCDGNLSDLLLKVGNIIEADRLVLCGDFNCPGADSMSVHGELSSALDAHGLQQFVASATRRTPKAESLLDLVIGSASSKRIQTVAVQSTHDVSDHDM